MKADMPTHIDIMYCGLPLVCSVDYCPPRSGRLSLVCMNRLGGIYFDSVYSTDASPVARNVPHADFLNAYAKHINKLLETKDPELMFKLKARVHACYRRM